MKFSLLVTLNLLYFDIKDWLNKENKSGKVQNRSGIRIRSKSFLTSNNNRK